MSNELKAFDITVAEEYYCEGIVKYRRAVYDKSEADKVIDFWKKESHDHYERYFKANKQLEGWFGKVCRCERAERELRHNKYKRCLAMARWCGSEVFVSDYEKDEPRMRWFVKWHKRWLELAEKFKEAK